MERDLVEQARHGDRDAFIALARAHGDRLIGIARRIVTDPGRAEDAVQQALVSAWRELPRLRDPDRFEPWLHRILIRICYAESRQARAWQSQVRSLVVEPSEPDATAVVAERDRIERGLRRLTPEQRAILVLRHYLGLEPAEIAERLGIPQGTARARLHHAHRAMRAALEADERALLAIGGRTS